MMWGYGNWDWSTWISIMIIMLVFLLMIFFTVVMLTRYVTPRSMFQDQPEYRNDPRQILAERFARGEIDEDEYLKRKAVLEKDN